MKRKLNFFDGDKAFWLGSCMVEPSSGTLRRNDEIVHLTPKVMELLLILVSHQGEVVSKEKLLTSVWPNTFVTESSLTRSISELRRSLNDCSSTSVYIETIPKKGYRLLGPGVEYNKSEKRSWLIPALGGVMVLFVGLLLFLLFSNSSKEETSLTASEILVVFPFERIGIESDSVSLTIGVVEDIVKSLSRINGLKVVSGTSLVYFEGTPEDLEKIADRLGIHTHMGGTFQQNEGYITISVRLSDASDQKILWKEGYSLNDWNEAEIVTEITQQVAALFNLHLKPSEVVELKRSLSDDFEARKYFLMADYLRKTGALDFREKAVNYAEIAIQRNPSSAQAYSVLAETYLAIGGWGQNEKWSLKAQNAVSKALSLDDQIPESHLANGILLRVYRKNFIAAEWAFREAIRLDPRNSMARREYGLLLMRNLGRLDEALHQLQEACRLDPLLKRSYSLLSELYYKRGEYGSALEAAKQEFEFHPSISFANRDLALAYMFLGENSLAIKWAEKSVLLLDFNPKSNQWKRNYKLLVLLYLHEDRFDEAEETSHLLNSISPGTIASLETAGLVALYKHEYREAESCFRQAYDLEPAGIVWPVGIRLSTFLGYILRYTGDQAGSEELLELSTLLNSEDTVVAYEKNFWPPLVFQDMLAGYSIRGEIDEGIRHLDAAVENGWNAYTIIEKNPLFENILKDQGLQEIFRTVKLRVNAMRELAEKQKAQNETNSFFYPHEKFRLL